MARSRAGRRWSRPRAPSWSSGRGAGQGRGRAGTGRWHARACHHPVTGLGYGPSLLRSILGGNMNKADKVRSPASVLLALVLAFGTATGLAGCGGSDDGPETIGSLRLLDRKSTRLNSSHLVISYAVFCLKKNNLLIYLCLPQN